MSLQIKIQRANRGPNESLCETCSWVLLQRGFSEGEQRVFCRFLDPNVEIHFRVRECNKYSDNSEQSLCSFEDIATVIEVRPGKDAGFHLPSHTTAGFVRQNDSE